jgi:hypothetical protein
MASSPTGPADQAPYSTANAAKVKHLFIEACDLRSDLRTVYLHEQCGSDAGLRAAVERLLEAHDQAGPFLAQPTQHSPTTVEPDSFVDGQFVP